MGRVSFKHGYAVVVGVDGFDPPVPVNDARGLARVLRDPGRCAYPKRQVKLLTARDASRDRILTALTWLATECKKDPRATAIIFYSGHGGQLGDDGPYFLVPHGYDENQFTETAIHGEEFVEKVKAVAAERLLVLLDCCHAAGLADAQPKGLPKAFVRKPMPPDFNRVLAEGRGRAVVASSRADELSWTGSPYSVFTGALLEGLAGYGTGERDDGLVRLLDVVNWIGRKVPTRSSQMQHPILDFARVEGFPLAYYAGGETTPKKLEWSQEALIEPSPGPVGAGPKRGGKPYQAIGRLITVAAIGLTAYWGVYGYHPTGSPATEQSAATSKNEPKLKEVPLTLKVTVRDLHLKELVAGVELRLEGIKDTNGNTPTCTENQPGSYEFRGLLPPPPNRRVELIATRRGRRESRNLISLDGSPFEVLLERETPETDP